jgi:hypothetical protein
MLDILLCFAGQIVLIALCNNEFVVILNRQKKEFILRISLNFDPDYKTKIK